MPSAIKCYTLSAHDSGGRGETSPMSSTISTNLISERLGDKPDEKSTSDGNGKLASATARKCSGAMMTSLWLISSFSDWMRCTLQIDVMNVLSARSVRSSSRGTIQKLARFYLLKNCSQTTPSLPGGPWWVPRKTKDSATYKRVTLLL